MTNRTAKVRFRDITTATEPLQYELPQGSPASPILFLLYTEPICRLGRGSTHTALKARLRQSANRRGYADDTAMLRTGNTLEQTTAEVTEDIDELIAWGAANGVTFDPEKTELMHFTRRTRAETTPTVFHNDTEITPAEALRWLGVWLD